jgi:16S rRNA (adenine1518-N6/adenine1519-N6)-dimethyltransferase
MTSARTLLKAWGIYPKKQFGQNFLKDPSTAQMIVSRGRIQPTQVVLEIGAGLGALTIPLAKSAQKVIAIEKDRQLVELLATELNYNQIENVEVISKDILSVDIGAISKQEDASLLVFGNLPYNISSQVLIQVMQCRESISRCLLMFQKELADRLLASPGGKTYGRISVMLQYCSTIKSIVTVPATQFFPKPKVDSVILEIDFSTDPKHNVSNEPFFFNVIKAGFSKRRKTLKNALSTSELHLPAQNVLQGLTAADIDPTRRAETLTVEEFVILANCLFEISSELSYDQ